MVKTLLEDRADVNQPDPVRDVGFLVGYVHWADL